jgi:excisionase family DNA binding protein
MANDLQSYQVVQVGPEASTRVLTVVEVSGLLRCSKAHVHNLINGKVPGVAPLPSLSLGRRRLVRRESLVQWLAASERGVL